MDDALLGTDRAVADDDVIEIGSDAKAHALTVTAAFVGSQFIHCRPHLLEPLVLLTQPYRTSWPQSGRQHH